ncbi:MAG: mevalonate kinase [Ilumatobacter sp.]|uniref:mevalonate kinase family protein n=1 Tax=Ilumatobacter sp. TaxID=1967498 RepID=UPI003918BC7C
MSVEPTPTVTIGMCSARAALAGNPSDGYGGHVVAVPVPAVRATVRVAPTLRFEIHHSPTVDDTFDDHDHLVANVDRYGYGDARSLILATLRALRRHLDARIAPVRLTVESSIPRSVGLAGSSAIVIATIRALMQTEPDADWVRPLADPAVLAALALSVEADELGVAAGLQDRVVQAFGEPMSMDFSNVAPVHGAALLAGRYATLAAPPGIMFVAVLDQAAGESGVTHRALRSEHDGDGGRTRRLMAEIAEQGRAAALAIERHDAIALGAAMDTTLDLRQSMMVLDPRLLAVSDAARGLGGHANWSGSGGAVTVLAPNDTVATSIRASVAELGGRIIDITD